MTQTYTANNLIDLGKTAGALTGTWYAQKAKDTAYAVFNKDTGELDFIRSTENHANGSSGTIKNIDGKSYTGTIYTGFEVNTKNYGNKDIKTLETGYYAPWFNDRRNIKKVCFINIIKPFNTVDWFYDMENCSSITGLTNLDTSETTDMRYMFHECSLITSLDASNLNTNKVERMDGMFQGCRSLTSLDISNFDTSNVIFMPLMFLDCPLSKLTLGKSFVTHTYTRLGAPLLPVTTKTFSGGESDGTWGLDSEHAVKRYTRDKFDNLGETAGALNGTWYAQATWSYTIKFDPNGGSGTMADEDMTVGGTSALTANAFTRTGYTFKSWNTKADGTGTSYADKASVKNLADKPGNTVTLYAQWTPNTYTVKFDSNGGTGAMANETMTYDAAKVLAANAFTNKDYDFIGWNTEKDGSGSFYTGKEDVKNLATSGTVTLYAQWDYNPHVILPNVGGKGVITIGLVSAFCILTYAEREILKKRKEIKR